MMKTHMVDPLGVESTQAPPGPTVNLPDDSFNDTFEHVALLSHELETSSAPEATEISDVFFDACSPTKLKRISLPSTEPSRRSELQPVLHVIENADFETASVLQKACISRMKKLRQDICLEVYTPDKKYEQKHGYKANSADLISRVPEAAFYGNSQLRESLRTPSKAPRPNTFEGAKPTPSNPSEPNEFHPSNPFHGAANSFAANSVPSGFDSPVHAREARKLQKRHIRHSSMSSQKTMKRSDSIVTQAGDKLRGSFGTMKDMVKEKAANIAAFSTPKKDRSFQKFDDGDDLLLFDSPKKGPKKLCIVREETPLGTPVWAVRSQIGYISDVDEKEEDSKEDNEIKKDKSEDSGHKKEDPPSFRLSLSEVDEDSFLGHENIVQYTTSSREISLPSMKETDSLLATPMSLSTAAQHRSQYPPRSSSLNSPASVNHYSNTGNVNESTTAFAHDNESGMSGMGEEDAHSEQDFQRIGNSHLMQGFRRINSDGQIISRATSYSEFESPRTAPKPPGNNEPVTPQMSTTHPRRTLTSLVQRGINSVKRSKSAATRKDRRN